jgi:hypothetical protein
MYLGDFINDVGKEFDFFEERAPAVVVRRNVVDCGICDAKTGCETLRYSHEVSYVIPSRFVQRILIAIVPHLDAKIDKNSCRR